MKKYICLVLSLLIIMMPVLTIAETQKFLKTPVAEMEVSAEQWCHDDLRALIAVGLQLSLIKQQGKAGQIDFQTTYVGYNEQSVFVVSAVSEKDRAVFELDTEYHMLLKRI